MQYRGAALASYSTRHGEEPFIRNKPEPTEAVSSPIGGNAAGTTSDSIVFPSKRNSVAGKMLRAPLLMFTLTIPVKVSEADRTTGFLEDLRPTLPLLAEGAGGPFPPPGDSSAIQPAEVDICPFTRDPVVSVAGATIQRFWVVP